MEQFLTSPLSYPVWKTISHFGLRQDDPILSKWWSKVVSEGKSDSLNKLFKYLQALTYFHTIADQFWSQMALNPTFFTVEAIVIRLTAMGDWIRSASFDAYGWSDRFYLLAKSVAHDEPNGNAIFKTLENAWPAGLKSNVIHYEQNPFSKAEFVVNEGSEQVVISPPLKMFKFNPDKVWAETEPSQSQPKPKESFVTNVVKKRKVSNELNLPEALEPLDSEEEDGHIPFATIGAESSSRYRCEADYAYRS